MHFGVDQYLRNRVDFVTTWVSIGDAWLVVPVLILVGVVLAALSAGFHVLCEKPLALSAGEVDIMVAASQLAGRRLVEASWNRWHPRTRLAAQLVADGAILPVDPEAAARLLNGASLHAALWVAASQEPEVVLAKALDAFRRLAQGLARPA